MSIVLALDEGTTNAKAVAIDHTGAVLATASTPLSIANTAPGWTEQDATEIWDASRDVLARVLAQVDAADVVGIAISNQRESVVAWNPGTGEPVGPVLSWQDTRTAGRCADLAGHAATVRERTGLPLDPMFSAPKMAWLLEQAVESTVVGTVDSWLVWCLTGGAQHVIEAGNASRTLLMDLELLDWHPALLDVFGIELGALPAVVASNGDFGETACAGLPAGIPILAVMADSHAALRGHGGGAPGVVKATYGTGSSVMQGTGDELRRRDGVATTLAWLEDGPVYALEGNIRYSGAALDWTSRLLGVPDAPALGELAATVDDAQGAVLVPAFGGLGAPHWDPAAVGTLTGLGAATGPAHVARAAFDAVAHQVADVAEAMLADGEALDAVRADGGATASSLLMQSQADVLGCDVIVVGEADVALRGVASLAFSRVGIALPPASPSRVHPPALDADRRAQQRAGWRTALDSTRR
ncbi:FGGY family carbohydrate kinase [Demequina sp. SYSU T00068]|uniref:FGGY family carbohydrate kinase n=1 Tax=Demequina lignilytica TaxID=3051663 RepID=UPI00262DC09D|nr:FGGY family carbohydrate kinase [Demequina sp. SYSU T00068]MDN4491650.1 FGGY family carbohydrate kinase [Demequina sp. SYSU T00068]